MAFRLLSIPVVFFMVLLGSAAAATSMLGLKVVGNSIVNKDGLGVMLHVRALLASPQENTVIFV